MGLTGGDKGVVEKEKVDERRKTVDYIVRRTIPVEQHRDANGKVDAALVRIGELERNWDKDKAELLDKKDYKGLAVKECQYVKAIVGAVSNGALRSDLSGSMDNPGVRGYPRVNVEVTYDPRDRRAATTIQRFEVDGSGAFPPREISANQILANLGSGIKRVKGY